MKHVLFSAWPDHQTPESAAPLLRLVAEVEESPEVIASSGPIVVHCRYLAPPSSKAPGPVPPPSPTQTLAREGFPGQRQSELR